MAKVTDTRDLLVHKLAVVYATEKSIEGTLPKLAREANDEELARGLERHLEETRAQIGRLEQAFELLGEPPRRAKAPAAEGLHLQHQAFAGEASEDVQPEVLDLVALGSAAATEHHEIAEYEALIALAENLGASELVAPLEQSLEEEQRMLGQVQGLARRLGASAEAADEDRSLAEDLTGGIREAARRLTGDDAGSEERPPGQARASDDAPAGRPGA
jgi:ferritin-like metal-binding protein YciE